MEETLLETPELDSTEDLGGDVELNEGESTDLGEESEAEGTEEATEGDESESDEPAEEIEAAAEVTADGRKMPDSLKKGIAALKATNPAAAKEIKGLFFSNQEYRAVFEKPADAVAAKTLIEEIGGQEGVQAIATEREEWQQIDRDFSEGKKEFVTSLAEGNPDAFLKTAPHVINEFATRAPEQYAYYANNVAINTMSAAGLTLDGLKNAYNAYKDNPGAQGIIAEVHNALAGLKEKATAFEQKRTDPREEALKQRETAFEEKRRADFENGVADKAEKYLSEKMTPELTRVIGNRKVDPDAMKGYQKMVNDKVMELLGAVPNFSTNLDAHYRTGDAAKSIAYIQAQYNKILPEAVKVIEPFLRNIGAGPKLVQTAKSGEKTQVASAGEVILKDMPDNSAFDWNKTTVADVISGHGVLKNGKRARGWA